MAEILGIAASGLSIGSLAIQIFASVQRVKHLWSAIKDASEDAQILLEELDLLVRLLSAVEDVENKSLERTGTVIEARRYCERAKARIETVVNELSDGPETSKSRIKRWTAINFVMRGKRVRKCVARLERAKSMLNLALQCLNQVIITFRVL